MAMLVSTLPKCSECGIEGTERFDFTHTIQPAGDFKFCNDCVRKILKWWVTGEEVKDEEAFK